MNTLVIATHNRKKAGEMVMILQGYFPSLEIKTLADFDGAPEPEETGTTYRDNARIKVESAVAFTGLPCIADDAGLEIDALDGAPGLYSKRFGGEDLDFPSKMARILELMEGAEDRSARFRCCVAYAAPGMSVEEFEATCEGRIGLGASGTGGFGYDPIFWPDGLDCTMADLTPEQKHAISHRGKVLRAFAERMGALT